MSQEPSSYRKRKAVKEPEVAINGDDRNPKKNKAPRASLDSMTLSQIASLCYGTATARVSTERVATANNASASNVPEQKASMRKIQDLAHSDNSKVNAALSPCRRTSSLSRRQQHEPDESEGSFRNFTKALEGEPMIAEYTPLLVATRLPEWLKWIILQLIDKRRVVFACR
jgi:hypothetical protein